MQDCGDPGCEHFKCKLASLQISPSAMPSRRNDVAPRGTRNNNWEKGIHRHSDGTPMRDESGKVIGLKEKSSTEVARMLRRRGEQASSLRGTT